MKNNSKTFNPSRREKSGNPWHRVDLSSPAECDRAIVDPYTFNGLLLQLHCNVKAEELTPEKIRETFEAELRGRMQCARETFEASLSEIYAAALADHADTGDPEDDQGEEYRRDLPDALRVIVGDGGHRTIVGPRGYQKMRREALEDPENPHDLAPWTELERYPAE